jgi:hypothetical protein
VVTVTETLDASMLTPMKPDGKKGAQDQNAQAAAALRPRGPFDTPVTAPLAGPPPVAEPHRFYVVYGVSRHGNRGGASPRPPVPLTTAPPAPAQPDLKATETGVVVGWAVPAGARLPYQEPAAAGEKPAMKEPGTGEQGAAGAAEVAGTVLQAKYSGSLEPAPELSYLVYLDSPLRTPTSAPATGSAQITAPAPRQAAPALLTAAPVKDLKWTDTSAEFGVERCYVVRAAIVQGPATLESDPSPVACITPMDTFPPPAPTSLAAVAGEGAISLIWVGVEAADLAGYLVLRGEGPEAPLAPVFGAPIRETTYRDSTVKAGVRYVYAVVAVDRAEAANRSQPSNKVEETAR